MKLRKIKIGSWFEPSQKDPTKMIKVSTSILIKNLINTLPPASIPRGIDAFRLMKEVSESLLKAEQKEFIYLSDSVYKFLEKECFIHIPAVWGMMKEPAMAISDLIDAELVDIDLEPQDVVKPQPEPEEKEKK